MKFPFLLARKHALRYATRSDTFSVALAAAGLFPKTQEIRVRTQQSVDDRIADTTFAGLQCVSLVNLQRDDLAEPYAPGNGAA
jgi:hypothetical protein